MLTFYIGALALAVVLCTGGRAAHLLTVRVRWAGLLWLALADQVLIISILPRSHPSLLAAAHLASYVAAGLCLYLNRKLPGAWLVALGGGLNGLVIALNGGELPAREGALRAAGRYISGEHFTNSGVLAHPKLAFLGDVFATPPWVPGHTVFSTGDILVWAGMVWFLYRTCRPVAAIPPGAVAATVLSGQSS